jgi:hypothetical protein
MPDLTHGRFAPFQLSPAASRRLSRCFSVFCRPVTRRAAVTSRGISFTNG